MSTRVNLKSTAKAGHKAPPRTPTGQGDKWIGSGCSTTDPLFVSGGIALIAQNAAGTTTGYEVSKQTIPGSSMYYRSIDGSSNRTEIDPLSALYPVTGAEAGTGMTGYAGLLIGDNPNNDTAYYDRDVTDPSDLTILKFARSAWAAGAELIIWDTSPKQAATTGHPVVGSLNARDYALWQISLHEMWADACNLYCPVDLPRTRVIPACNVYLRIYDDIAAGVAPSGMTWADLYNDDVHPSKLGRMVLQITAAATLWHIDPMTADAYDTDVTASEDVISYVRRAISDVIKTYPRAGANTTGWT